MAKVSYYPLAQAVAVGNRWTDREAAAVQRLTEAARHLLEIEPNSKKTAEARRAWRQAVDALRAEIESADKWGQS